MKFEETKVSPNDSQGNLFVDFDITNQSSTNYDVQTGSKPIYIDIKVTTTDGKVYDSSQILTVTSLAAGSTASSQLLGNYGSGKTYKSYTATLVCK